MTVEELKDLTLCLIEEGKDNSIIAIRRGDVISQFSLDDILLLSPASDFLCPPDIDRFSK